MKIGHDGDAQIAELLGVDPATVARGRHQLLSGEVERVRRAGGARRVDTLPAWGAAAELQERSPGARQADGRPRA